MHVAKIIQRVEKMKLIYLFFMVFQVFAMHDEKFAQFCWEGVERGKMGNGTQSACPHTEFIATHNHNICLGRVWPLFGKGVSSAPPPPPVDPPMNTVAEPGLKQGIKLEP